MDNNVKNTALSEDDKEYLRLLEVARAACADEEKSVASICKEFGTGIGKGLMAMQSAKLGAKKAVCDYLVAKAMYDHACGRSISRSPVTFHAGWFGEDDDRAFEINLVNMRDSPCHRCGKTKEPVCGKTVVTPKVEPKAEPKVEPKAETKTEPKQKAKAEPKAGKVPVYYDRKGYTPFDIATVWEFDPFRFTAIKYMCRMGLKPGVAPKEDIGKAINALTQLLGTLGER